MSRWTLLFALVSGTIVLVWYGLGRPVPVPALPLAEGNKLNCLSYSPFHGSQTPYDEPLLISERQIAGDLERLAEVTSCIRSYSAGGAQGKVTDVAADLGFQVYQGIWISRDLAENRKEIEAALQLAKRHPGTVRAFIVGNEVMLRGELAADRIETYLQEVRRRSGLPVTYADVWEFWLKSPDLASAVDFITIHILPYWEDVPVAAGEALDHVRAVRARIAAAFPGKEIWIGEVGWPSAGRMRARALPSPANQALVLRNIVAAATEENWKVNLIEAFDQPWKRLLEGTVGGYWGVFDDAKRQPKFRWGEPISNFPRWQLMAALGIAASLLVFVAALVAPRSSANVSPARMGGVAAIAASCGLVFGWAALGLPMEPPILGDRLRSALMLLLSLAVPAAAAAALLRGAALDDFRLAVNPGLWRSSQPYRVLLAVLFAATVVAAMHVALGFVFDPRYKDFQLALLTGPAAALAILAWFERPEQTGPAPAEKVAAALLGACALFIVANEGLANWQALWLAALLLLLGFSALRAAASPG